MGQFAKPEDETPLMGFFTWHVSSNMLFGDPVFAGLYDIPNGEASAGIDVENILGKISNKDRPRIAKNIHDAIITGQFSSAQYQIDLAGGRNRSLVAFGRCLHDQDGVPSFYSGTIIEVTSSRASLGDDPLLVFCRAALNLAEQRGSELTARYLSSALLSAGVDLQSSP
ncbi:hypothetical protein RMS29_026490 (plasmid) [Agrobacterium rosae]|uniref:PAS fold protein n=1 Tax=Agrobacterium rosae TaxID=1972867 RepID=A0ABU4W294_9HYPH|nr:hypothetical protein [Agrobacterium rosae]MDX8331898.1 hypothetical protein [Agrobacterium rosae]